MSNAALELKNISRDYAQGQETLHILRNVNIAVNQGEVVALVGPSGSGKTTLLQIAGLLDTPTSGEVLIAGKSAAGLSDNKRTALRRNHIGFIYQFHHLLPEFTALENVVIPQMIAGVKESAAEAHAKSLLAELGLGARFTHRPAELSGGEQQRVAIARALANNPALILADEPTGNLDPATAESVFTLFMKLAQEKNLAALVATHNMELAGRMSRIIKVPA